MRASRIGRVDALATLRRRDDLNRQDAWTWPSQSIHSPEGSIASPGPATAGTGSASASWCSAGASQHHRHGGRASQRLKALQSNPSQTAPISSLPASPSLLPCSNGTLISIHRQHVQTSAGGAVARYHPLHARSCARQPVLLRCWGTRWLHHRPLQQHWNLRILLPVGRSLFIRQRMLESETQRHIPLWLHRLLLQRLHLPVQVR